MRERELAFAQSGRRRSDAFTRQGAYNRVHGGPLSQWSASRQSGPVAYHQFWGTENVVGALKAVDPDGYAKGEVCLTKDMIMRGENGYVCGIRPKSEMNMVVSSE